MAIKIYTQNDLRTTVTPRPGIYFVSDDGQYYLILNRHPNSSAESHIKFSEKVVDDADINDNLMEFYAIRPLIQREIDILIGHAK